MVILVTCNLKISFESNPVDPNTADWILTLNEFDPVLTLQLSCYGRVVLSSLKQFVRKLVELNIIIPGGNVTVITPLTGIVC